MHVNRRVQQLQTAGLSDFESERFAAILSAGTLGPEDHELVQNILTRHSKGAADEVLRACFEGLPIWEPELTAESLAFYNNVILPNTVGVTVHRLTHTTLRIGRDMFDFCATEGFREIYLASQSRMGAIRADPQQHDEAITQWRHPLHSYGLEMAFAVEYAFLLPKKELVKLRSFAREDGALTVPFDWSTEKGDHCLSRSTTLLAVAYDLLQIPRAVTHSEMYQAAISNARTLCLTFWKDGDQTVIADLNSPELQLFANYVDFPRGFESG